MPRKPRIEFEGAIYHVMCRGDRQEAVFRDNWDNERFLDTLGEVCVRCGWHVHAFVLMGNHYHLLIETPEANLVTGMQWLQGTYTCRFNVRHREWGHLFQGRYKALPIDGSGAHFLTVASYIHLNPARIRGFDFERSRLEDHVWSSYPGYLWLKKRPEWLCVRRMLGCCGLSDTSAGRRAYRMQIEKRLVEMQHAKEPWKADEQWSRIRRGWCLGDELFHEEMQQRLEGTLSFKQRASFTGTELKRHDEVEAERLIESGLAELRVKESDLPAMKKNCAEKYAIAWLIRRNTCVRPAWIKERLSMGKATNFSEFLKQLEAGTFGRECFERIQNIKS